ncbi:hypothetical protein C8J57DRAFT_1233385 [Mycena rebaudengoi]|nr:hypothetical protein C8J57DRAFT_1233385 [Mycena rebaudengoi]
MCFSILCGHQCWQYNPDLEVIFPYHPNERRYALVDYLAHFLYSINQARTVTKAELESVLYCRTRSPDAYPFLIVYLKHPQLFARPVVLKLQGFDGPLTRVTPDPDALGYYQFGLPDCRHVLDPEERSTVAVKGYYESVRELVGCKRPYDVCHTLTKFRQGYIADLLVLAELATEQDGTRAVYPATLFLALQTFGKGVVTNSTKRRARAAPLPSDIAGEARDAVLAAFPARRQRMKDALHSGRYWIEYLASTREPPPSDEGFDTEVDL